MYVLSIEEGTKSPKERAKYLAQAIVLSKVARPQRSPRRFHFVQWFVITAANMVHAGSSSHPKRQANYNSRQRPRKPLKRAHADGPIRIS